MVKANSKKNSENEDLLCPITLEVFRDPVIAGDGHVYEREAITRWISEHGTSPLTRNPLQIDELQPYDPSRSITAQRKNSVVSYNPRNHAVTVSPAAFQSRNTATNVRTLRQNRCTVDGKYKIVGCVCLCMCICLVLIFLATYRRIINGRNRNRYINCTVCNATTTEPEIISSYLSLLTINSSVFIPPGRRRPITRSCYYQEIYFTVSIDGYYKFRSNSPIDMSGYLYSSYFDSNNPNDNLLIYDDDSGGSLQFYFSISLPSGNYTLVATTYRRNTIGSFSIIVTGPAIVTFR